MSVEYKNQWEQSYQNKDNFLFYPHEDVIRFFSVFINKRIGLKKWQKKHTLTTKPKVLDLGCGIGRHLAYIYENGGEPFGVDLSETAIEVAKNWVKTKKYVVADDNIKQADIRQLPFNDDFFDFILSHGVLDSMPLDIAREGFKEAARVLKPNSFFYCDIISGDDSSHSKEFSGEEIVETVHEKGTIQLYYSEKLIRELIFGYFDIERLILKKEYNLLSDTFHSRYHLVLRKK